MLLFGVAGTGACVSVDELLVPLLVPDRLPAERGVFLLEALRERGLETWDWAEEERRRRIEAVKAAAEPWDGQLAAISHAEALIEAAAVERADDEHIFLAPSALHSCGTSAIAPAATVRAIPLSDGPVVTIDVRDSSTQSPMAARVAVWYRFANRGSSPSRRR